MLVQITRKRDIGRWQVLGHSVVSMLYSCTVLELFILKIKAQRAPTTFQGPKEPYVTIILIAASFLKFACHFMIQYVYTNTSCGVHLLLLVSPALLPSS